MQLFSIKYLSRCNMNSNDKHYKNAKVLYLYKIIKLSFSLLMTYFCELLKEQLPLRL